MRNWEESQVEVLFNLYVENDMPSDQLISEENALNDFVSKLNERIGNPDYFSNEDVAQKLLGFRKAGKLPRIRK